MIEEKEKIGRAAGSGLFCGDTGPKYVLPETAHLFTFNLDMPDRLMSGKIKISRDLKFGLVYISTGNRGRFRLRFY